MPELHQHWVHDHSKCSPPGCPHTGPCPDCAEPVGAEHGDGCDVARCLETGLQRLSCTHDHDCGRDRWTGEWPATLECERYRVDLNTLTGSGRWAWSKVMRQWVEPGFAAAMDPFVRTNLGFGRRNPHCSNCGDLRGGYFGHEASECKYRYGMTAGEVAAILPDHQRNEFWDQQIDRYFAEQEPAP